MDEDDQKEEVDPEDAEFETLNSSFISNCSQFASPTKGNIIFI